MKEVLVGLVAMGVGGLLSFGGYYKTKVMLSIWSTVVGFLTGAGVVAATTGDGLLQTSMGWLIGLVFSVVFLLAAYSFYEAAMVVHLSASLFLIAAGLMSVFGVDWNWTVGLIAAVLGLVVGLSTMTMDLPAGSLRVVNSLGGSLVLTQGFMLLVGLTSLTSFEVGAAVAMPNSSWAWLVVWLVLALSGYYVQSMRRGNPVGLKSDWR